MNAITLLPSKQMQMRQFLNIALFIAISICALLLSVSCNGVNGENDSRTTTVILNVGIPGAELGVEERPWTRADAVEGTQRYVDAAQYEDIRTLRVIVSDGPKSIVFNHLFKVNTDFTVQQGSPMVTLTIEDVPVGEVSFYVIANESSILNAGESYDNDRIMNALGNSTKIVHLDENRQFFPRTGPQIQEHGIPMTGSRRVTLSESVSSVTVTLIRSVAKINLKIENATTSEIKLTEVKFGAFNGNTMYLFPTETLDVPDNAGYIDLTYTPQDITVAGGEQSDWLAVYIYPAYATRSDGNPFTLQLKTLAGNTYGPTVFDDNITAIPRNTQVNILAKINTDVGLELKFEVADWESYDIIVPDFK